MRDSPRGRRPPLEREAELWGRVARLAALVADGFGAGRVPVAELGAAWRAVTDLRPRLGVRGQDGVARLTAREAAVLRRVADGRTNHQIAADLGITEETVKTHLRRLFHRLDAKDRAQAVAVALRAGLMR